MAWAEVTTRLRDVDISGGIDGRLAGNINECTVSVAAVALGVGACATDCSPRRKTGEYMQGSLRGLVIPDHIEAEVRDQEITGLVQSDCGGVSEIDAQRRAGGRRERNLRRRSHIASSGASDGADRAVGSDLPYLAAARVRNIDIAGSIDRYILRSSQH